jgi:hypothetical protein
VADWAVIASIATAGGTTVLALATFSATRSANRSARIAEESLLTRMQPLLLQSHYDDPPLKALWNDFHTAKVEGGRAVLEYANHVIYLAIGLRNVGSGIALLHGWSIVPEFFRDPPPDAAEFRRLVIDLYVPAGGSGYWESAIRDTDDPAWAGLQAAIDERTPITVDLLYGDQHGGQRTISRFTLLPGADSGWYAQANRHWNVDRPDPR